MRTMSESSEMGNRKENFFGGLLRKARFPPGKEDNENANDGHQSTPDPNWPQKAQITKKKNVLSWLKVYDDKINPYGKHKHMRDILLNTETFAKVIETPKGYQNCAPARLCINIEDMSVLLRETLDIEALGHDQKLELKGILEITNAITREYQAMVDILGPFIGTDSVIVPGAIVLLSVSNVLKVVEKLLKRMQELADEYENWMLEAARFQGDSKSEGTGSGDERDASTTAIVGE